MMILSDISVEGVYRLLTKLVKTIPKDDPEYELWRQFGERLRLNLSESATAAPTSHRPGYMDRRYVETEGLRRHGRLDTNRTSSNGDIPTGAGPADDDK